MNPIEKVSLILCIIFAVVIYGGREYTEKTIDIVSTLLFVFVNIFMWAGLLNKDITK